MADVKVNRIACEGNLPRTALGIGQGSKEKQFLAGVKSVLNGKISALFTGTYTSEDKSIKNWSLRLSVEPSSSGASNSEVTTLENPAGVLQDKILSFPNLVRKHNGNTGAFVSASWTPEEHDGKVEVARPLLNTTGVFDATAFSLLDSLKEMKIKCPPQNSKK